MPYVATEVVATPKAPPPPQNAERLLDLVTEHTGVKNDAALCRLLKIAPPVLSKIRHKRNRVSADLLLLMYDKTGLSIDQLRDALYDLEEA